MAADYSSGWGQAGPRRRVAIAAANTDRLRRAMRLVATLASPAPSAGQPGDLAFALTLTNDGAARVVTCAAKAPFADAYGLPTWNMQLAAAGRAASATIPCFRAQDPRFGAPAPPW